MKMGKKIWFCAGTAGELIKLYPLVRICEQRQLEWRFVFTGQSPVNFWIQWRDLELDIDKAVSVVDSEKDLESKHKALFWFLKALRLTNNKLLSKFREKLSCLPRPDEIWVVHGDTLSTVIGSIWARKLSCKIAHVEAGLRSNTVFSPFPEEISRRIVSKLARVHYAQDEQAILNLERSKVAGQIVNSKGNTLYDALNSVDLNSIQRDSSDIPLVVANIHRNENLGDADKWNVAVETLCKAAKNHKVMLVLHPPTKLKLEMDIKSAKKLEEAGVFLSPRLPFSQFIKLIHQAKFIISDGGSNQEECAYLGKPCLILRTETERTEGLTESCVLTKFDKEIVDNFMLDPESFSAAPVKFTESPSELIVASFIETVSRG